jgi:large subunit ribosomal protein L21
MYAIFEDGSHQYRVEEGSVVIIDYRDVKAGDVLELNKVLLIGAGDKINIGQPLVAGAKVMAEVIGFPRTKTVTQYFRRRKNSKKLRGHTQPHLRVKVTSIVSA